MAYRLSERPLSSRNGVATISDSGPCLGSCLHPPHANRRVRPITTAAPPAALHHAAFDPPSAVAAAATAVSRLRLIARVARRWRARPVDGRVGNLGRQLERGV